MEPPVVRSRGRPRKRRREEAESGEISEDSNNNHLDNSNNNNEVDVKEVEGNGNVNNNQGKVQITGSGRKRGRPPKKRPVEGQAVVGRYVMKEFEGDGVFLGKIVSYDSGLYRVEYEDGDCEDLDSDELRQYLVGEERFVEGDLLERRKKLDGHLTKKSGGKVRGKWRKGNDVVCLVDMLEKEDVVRLRGEVDQKDVGSLQNDVVKVEEVKVEEVKVEVPSSSEVCTEHVGRSGFDGVDDDDGGGGGSGGDEDDDDDSSSDSCEYGQGWENRSETEVPSIPPPELPPSSGNIRVPEEYVSHLFSVYGFLRSFSIHLFLSPFTLDDLVGCLNCTVPNTLLDSIHVALLRALRRHLETSAADGSELASKCLRCIDWGLLDMLTWPIYLVHYLMVMGHLTGDQWKGFYTNALEKDYFSLSVGIKLTVLQILCDDALDTAEIRAEIDLREGSEVGVDFDGSVATPVETEPRKVYPRYCKTSVGKDTETAHQDSENVAPSSSNSSNMNANDRSRDEANADDDGNVDECRLCGMDGMLLCCDGCPSAYHSRCIGVNKLSIPEGEWFCPECTISRIGPAITAEPSLKGAEVFGIDSYAQLFLGTCNHLLVLKVSVKSSCLLRYYNQTDILKVVAVLCSSPQHAVSYLGICQAILKYWRLPQSVLPPFINTLNIVASESRDGNTLLPTQVHPYGENGIRNVLGVVEPQNCASTVGRSFLDNVSGSGTEKSLVDFCSSDVSLGVPKESELAGVVGTPGATITHDSTNMTSKLLEQTELSCLTQQGLVDRMSVVGNASCPSAMNSSSSSGQKNGIRLSENIHMHGKGDSNGVGGRIDQMLKDKCLYLGSNFKPYAYINHFVHGDFAASAAANFADLSPDVNRVSEIHASDPRKAMSAKVALQAKAFSSVAVRFFWPSTEKKLMDVPRERCSWCLHCKASGASRKACLLNQAALNATRAAMKFLSGLRLAKSVEAGMYGIATYTLYMEESLRGLILGSFQMASYRQEWRKKVEQVSTYSDMKDLLLELERNLCTIALSAEWTKLVDNWMDESSVPQSSCPTGLTQKRGPGRRKKHVPVAEATANDSDDSSNDLRWWRGGKLAKLVFQRGTMPYSIIKKAARQGGSRRLPGVYYADGSDVPKRSRQFIWRAAVEMARNASQLALQVRYLDHHIKWSDLLRPEQTPQDGKGPETETLAFRNGTICGKKVVDNKITYGVVFGHQKHFSSRLMKSIIEKEESEDGKDKYWFSETRIPLYLIKEYEENAENYAERDGEENAEKCEERDSKLNADKSAEKHREENADKSAERDNLAPPEKLVALSEHQKRQLKASRKNVFCYLVRKRDDENMCPCASCHEDVSIREAGKCSACEGYCHMKCITSSTVVTSETVKRIDTCNQCLHGKAFTQINGSVESPTSPLAMQGQDYPNSVTVSRSAKSKSSSQQYQNSATVSKSARLKNTCQQSPSVGTLEIHSNKKAASSDSHLTKSKKRPLHWGLIWKKKDAEDGSNFQLRHILLKGEGQFTGLSPSCYLCHKPYDPDLMYIHCDACKFWYHADAVELDDSKLNNLVGFKCCRCRRIRSPICPYADSNTKKVDLKKITIKGPKEEAVPATSFSEAISEQTESVPSTPISPMDEDVYIQVDDPTFLPDSEVEQIPEPKAEVDLDWNTLSGPQKLPVRRQVKNEKDDDGFTGDQSLVPPCFESKNVTDFSQAEWEVSSDGLEGAALHYDNFSCENTDFEPQTYFSFTELLESDEGNQIEGVDASGVAWENFSFENSRTGFPDQFEMGSNIEHVNTEFMEPTVNVACDVCLKIPPAPDLCCQNCGLQIHSQCSPWEEEFSQGQSWRCGNCRVWR